MRAVIEHLRAIFVELKPDMHFRPSFIYLCYYAIRFHFFIHGSLWSGRGD